MVAIPNAPRIGDMPKGEPVPEGVYHLRCDKATYKVSKPKEGKPGTPMAECELTIFGPAEAEQYHGRKIFENFMLAGEGLFRTRMFLEAAGKPEDFILDDTEHLLSLEAGALIQVEPERVNPAKPGEKFPARNKVKKYLPIGA